MSRSDLILIVAWGGVFLVGRYLLALRGALTLRSLLILYESSSLVLLIVPLLIQAGKNVEALVLVANAAAIVMVVIPLILWRIELTRRGRD